MQLTLKTIVRASRIRGHARALREWLIRKVTVNEAKIIERYLVQEGTRKLQLGCGRHTLKGWLNSDYAPNLNNVISIDATKTYPFEANTFDYIFSEHMIEHFSLRQGHLMLRECFRVLRDGGKLRISTPDLAFLISLYQTDKSELQKEYIKWSTQTFISGAPSCEDTFVINNFVRDWGHTFIYDEKALRFAMQEAGFKEITRFALNESEDLALRDLENIHRMPEGFLRLESMTLEGTKGLSNTFD